jgi:hypothetical protein
MAKKSRASFQKRQKEQARQQKRKDRAARRLEAKQHRANAALGMGETTLDTADRRPGPQPLPTMGRKILRPDMAIARLAPSAGG